MSIFAPFNSHKGAIVTESWEGLENKVSPIGLKYELREGELFEYLMKEFDFEEYVEMRLNPDLSYLPDDMREHSDKVIEKIKSVVSICKPKITIKIEMQGYLND